MYKVEYTRIFQKDLMKIKQYPAMFDRLQGYIDSLIINPYDTRAEKLQPKTDNKYSLRLNIQHRLVYEIHEDRKAIKLLSCWSHYERM